MEQGGPVVVILMILSILALTIVLSKIVDFWMSGVWSLNALSAHVDRAIGGHDRSGNRRRLITRRSVARTGRLAAFLNRALAQEGSWDVRQRAIQSDATTGIDQLKSKLRYLELIASISPLIGLFGTVLGMIDAFQALENAGSRVDPAILSGGIWTALLTTAVGLAVAIPTTAAVAFFERTLERVAASLSHMANRILDDQVVSPIPDHPFRADHALRDNHPARNEPELSIVELARA